MITAETIDYIIFDEIKGSHYLLNKKNYSRNRYLQFFSPGVCLWTCHTNLYQGNIYKLTLCDPNVIIEIPNQSGNTYYCNKQLNWFYKHMILTDLLNSETERYGHYIEDTIENYMPRINDFLDQISKLEYEKPKIELTPEKSIFVKLDCKKVFINIELFLNIPSGNEDEVFFTVFEDNKCLTNGTGSVKNVIQDIMDIVEY